MLVMLACIIVGILVGFMLSAILRAGAVSDLRVALLMTKEENKELRSQLHVTLLNAHPYECGGSVNSDEVKQDPDLLDLGEDHDGSLRFIPYVKG